jgi:hypothetical protein
LAEERFFNRSFAELSAYREYIYLILGWLGGTVSKQVVEQAIKAAADVVLD